MSDGIINTFTVNTIWQFGPFTLASISILALKSLYTFLLCFVTGEQVVTKRYFSFLFFKVEVQYRQHTKKMLSKGFMGLKTKEFLK